MTWLEEPCDVNSISAHAQLGPKLRELGIQLATGEVAQHVNHGLDLFPHIDAWQGDLSRFTMLDQIVLAIYGYKLKKEGGTAPSFSTHAGGTALNSMAPHSIMTNYCLGLSSLEDVQIEHIDLFDHHFDPEPLVSNGRYQAPTAPGLVSVAESAREFCDASDTIWQKN